MFKFTITARGVAHEFDGFVGSTSQRHAQKLAAGMFGVGVKFKFDAPSIGIAYFDVAAK